VARRLDGRLVLLTGASSGIGRAAVPQFVARGARVVAVARRLSELERLAAELGGPTRVLPLRADVSDAASMAALAAEAERAAGLPDVVVANAGLGADARFAETGDELWRQVLEVNVLGVARTLRPFLPGMTARGSGRLVVVSSVVGKRGTPHYAAYSASKFALHGLADALRAELCGTGVSVGLVCPGSTDTPFQEHVLRSGPAQRRVRPVRRTAEWVARAVVDMACSRRAERVLGLECKLFVLGDLLAPRLIDWMLGRALARRA